MGAVCFLHIPKTSGTSVKLYLDGQFAATDICPARGPGEFVELGPARLSLFSLFRADCDAAVLDLLPSGTSVVTFLREPLARAYSHWRYIRRFPEHRLHRQFQSEGGGFEQFVESVPPNPMAQLLAAASGGEPRRLWEQPNVWGDGELYDRAVARLESFAVVGLTECHERSVAELAHTFGWAPPGRLPRTNANDPIVEDWDRCRGVQTRFEERNSVDLELYRTAREMVERRYRLSDGGSRRARYERRLAMSSEPLRHRRVIDLCSPIDGSGWLPAVDSEVGRLRPVGGGGHASIDIPVTLGRFTKMEVTCPAAVDDQELATLEILVNGETVSFTTSTQPNGVILHALLPPSGATDRYTRIEFRTSGGVALPANYTGALTDVVVTLAISRVELIPYDARMLKLTAVDNGGRTTVPRRSTAGLFVRESPTWTIEPDLRTRLDALDLWPRVAELQRDGFTIVPDVIDHDTLGRARDAICRMAVGTIQRTRRGSVLLPLRTDPLFADLLVHPVQLALADVVCGKALLGQQTGLVRDRTSNPQGLHAENALWLPAPYPMHHFVCSTMLTLDDFDEANGGTCFVPGSHLSRVNPSEMELRSLSGVVTPVVRAGSFIVWLGGTWHGARQRTKPGERVSLLSIFTRPSLRAVQDIKGVPDAVVTTDELRLRLRRTDYFEHNGVFGDDESPMVRWIRNVPQEGSLNSGWSEVIDPADRSGVTVVEGAL